MMNENMMNEEMMDFVELNDEDMAERRLSQKEARKPFPSFCIWKSMTRTVTRRTAPRTTKASSLTMLMVPLDIRLSSQ